MAYPDPSIFWGDTFGIIGVLLIGGLFIFAAAVIPAFLIGLVGAAGKKRQDKKHQREIERIRHAGYFYVINDIYEKDGVLYNKTEVLKKIKE